MAARAAPAAVAVLVFGGAAVAQAPEEILSFHVTLDVARDGSVHVTEDIALRAGEEHFVHGLVRSYPTSHWRVGGVGWVQLPFAFRSALLNGTPASYRVTATGGAFGRSGVRVRVGPSLWASPGIQRYRLEWETERRTRFGPVEDTLAWEVTGRDWSVPVREASVEVRVEQMDVPLVLEAWASSRAGSERAVPTRAGEAGAAATEPVDLAPGEGLALRLVLPKWTVRATPYHQEREWFWLDWGGWIEAGVGVLAVVALYVLMWLRVGVDRRGGPVVVQYEPPRGLSAAAIGYLHRRGYHASQYAAALVGLAVKGAVRVHRASGRWRVERTGSGTGLLSDERAVLGTLLGNASEVTLEPGNASHLARGAQALRNALAGQLERAFFVANRRWWLAGIATGAVALAVLAWRWRFDVEAGSWAAVVFLELFTLVAVSLLARSAAAVRHGRAGGGSVALVQGGVLVVAALPFALLTLVLAQAVNQMVPGHLLAAGIAVGVTNAAFYHLLERPTRAGRGVLDRVEGFRRFLAAVDRDRLRRMVGNEPGPDVAERFLPHAIALGIEEAWASRLGALLTPPTGMDGGVAVEHWCQVDGAGSDPAALMAALGDELPDALAAALRG